jgi:pimeloyl-ACP methyl ester carboxylesterase
VSDSVRVPDGVVPIRRFGTGEPVTLLAHGLSAGPAETRILASGVAGTKVFYPARGHPGGLRPGGGYPELAADLAAVAAATSASQVIGASLGAATVLHLLTGEPAAFRKVVLFLPASFDRASESVCSLVPAAPPVARPAMLAAVSCPVLVIAAQGDPQHQVEVAEAVAAAIPGAWLEVFGPGGLLAARRARLRGLIAGFLAAAPG